MNVVMRDRILELSETPSRFYKIKKFVSNWKHVIWVSLALFTAKIAAEQLVMLLRGWLV